MESQFNLALGMCQLALSQSASQGKGVLSAETISATVKLVTSLAPFSEIDQTKLIEQLEARFTIFTRPHLTLGSDDDHQPWLLSKKGKIAWRFWDRYRLHAIGNLPEDSINSIDRVSDDVLSRIEDPERIGPWDRRGLVVGDVQSGKTANYTGLICKASDAGYKVIIVLAGIHNSLRSQTQIRLDEGFTGFMSVVRNESNDRAHVPVGVGLKDSSVKANSGTNRAENGDFSTQVANQFGIHPGGLPLVFVIKKNASVLNNLLSWLGSHTDGQVEGTKRKFIRGVPSLIIDDEADLASIDTKNQAFDQDGKPNLDHNPAKINELIRLVIRSFEKVAYVAYTATPFANIYIHDKGSTTALGDDLFPRSFIVDLPAPSNYIGPATVFGIQADEDAGLEEVPALPLVIPVSDHCASSEIDEVNGWMPPKLLLKTDHIPMINGIQKLPPSLREAILFFILSTTIRRFRNVTPKHCSMLVHVVRYTKIQNRIGDQVRLELREIVQRLRNGDGSRTPTILSEFLSIWEKELVPNHERIAVIRKDILPLPTWESISVLISDVAQSIDVKIINGSAGDVLAYEENKENGLNVIAIGGDKLSRGLTLEGLSVSYFLRASRMYDTLMQMGRWFGYRDGYLDVCRLYATSDLINWFTHIASATQELKIVFKHMVAIGETPKNYGLRVRSHDALLVTAGVKMRHGTELKVSYSGDVKESINFSRNQFEIQKNFNTVEKWLAGLGKPITRLKSNGYLWENVSATEVIGFLKNYSSHKDSLHSDSKLIAKYIDTQVANTELVHWTVCLISNEKASKSEPPHEIAGNIVGYITRAEFPSPQISDRYSIRRLVSPKDEAIDLTQPQQDAALAKTIANWRVATEPKRIDEPDSPGGRESREQRKKTHGLLLIYPLDPTISKPVLGTTPYIGIAVSLPVSNTARPISYVVNNRYLHEAGDDESI